MPMEGTGDLAAQLVASNSSQNHLCTGKRQTCPLTAPMGEILHPQSKGEEEMVPKPPKKLQEPAELPAVRLQKQPWK